MIDTLTISTELERLGFPKEQANAIAQIEAVKQDNPATKDDIARLEGKIDSIKQALGDRINSVEKDLKSEIASVKGKVENVKGEITSLKIEVENMKIEVENVKGEIASVRTEIKHVERVLGERINSVGSRLTGLYWFMGIVGGGLVLGQFVLSLLH